MKEYCDYNCDYNCYNHHYYDLLPTMQERRERERRGEGERGRGRERLQDEGSIAESSEGLFKVS